MSINFTRLFTTLGYLCGGLNETNTWRGTTLPARRTTVAGQFGTVAAYGPFVSGWYNTITAAEGAENGYVAALSALTEEVVVAEVKADRPLLSAALSDALAELVRQMGVSAQTLNDCPGTVTVAAVGSPNGNGKFVFSTYDPIGNGHASDFLVPDVLLVECTADRSTGGAQWAATHSVVGKPLDALPTDATYPSGSGVNTSITETDPATDGGLVTLGGFDSGWSGTGSNTPPAPWAIFGTAVAGTQVKRSTDDPRGGTAYSLDLIGDGSAVIKIRQPVTVQANHVYNVHFRVKKVADPGTDWAVSVILTDATGATIAGNNAYSNVVSSAACTSLSADWLNPVVGQFQTPAVLPTTQVYVEIRMHQSGALTTAAVNTAEALVDHVSVVDPGAALYPGGPQVSFFSGTLESVVGDTRTATVALASGTASAYLIRGIDRLLDGQLSSAAVRVPTVAGGGETISDSLVV